MVSGPMDQPTTDHRDGSNVERVERDAAGRLVLHLTGEPEPIADVRVARCFPWSLPDSFISIRDPEGKEILLLETLDELDEPARSLVAEELRDKIFSPRIRRVLEFKEEFGVTSVRADTDRGEVTFQIRSRDDIRVLSPVRALFRDVDGNTYDLPDHTALDPASRRYIQHYF